MLSSFYSFIKDKIFCGKKRYNEREIEKNDVDNKQLYKIKKRSFSCDENEIQICIYKQDTLFNALIEEGQTITIHKHYKDMCNILPYKKKLRKTKTNFDLIYLSDDEFIEITLDKNLIKKEIRSLCEYHFNEVERKFYEKMSRLSQIMNDLKNYPPIDLEDYKIFAGIFNMKYQDNCKRSWNFLRNLQNHFEETQEISCFLSLKSWKKLGKNIHLNDEVINSYINILKKRLNNSSLKKIRKYPKIYLFNTYFFDIIGGNKNNVFNSNQSISNFNKIIKGLIKQNINLKYFETIIVPLLINNKEVSYWQNEDGKLVNCHWALLKINLNNKSVLFYEFSESNLEDKIFVIERVCQFFSYYSNNIDSIQKLNFSGTIDCFIPNTPPKNSSVNVTNHQTPSEKKMLNFSKIYINNESFEDNNQSFNSEATSFLEENELDIEISKYEGESLNTQINSNFSKKFEENNSSNIQTKIFKKEKSINVAPRMNHKYSYSVEKWKFKKANTFIIKTPVDGGVYICKVMDYIMRNEPITFTKNHCEYFRTLLGVELTNQVSRKVKRICLTN